MTTGCLTVGFQPSRVGPVKSKQYDRGVWCYVWKVSTFFCFTSQKQLSEKDPKKDSEKGPKKDSEKDPKKDSEKDPKKDSEKDSKKGSVRVRI